MAETITAQWKDEEQVKWQTRVAIACQLAPRLTRWKIWMTSCSGCPDWLLHSEERQAWRLISAGFDTADNDLSMASPESNGCPFRTLQINSELHIHLLTGPLLIHTSAPLLLQCSFGLTWSILTQPAVSFSLVYFYCKYGTQSSASASASCVITFY